MSRRIAAVVAAPVGVYAVLLLVSLLGGPRIGAPLIPLPGPDGPEAATPVAGPLNPAQPTDGLPSIPPEPTPAPSTPPKTGTPAETDRPCQAGTGRPEELCRPIRPSGTITLAFGHPSRTTPPMEPVEPTPGVVERSGPSMPPATKTPPVPPTTTPPGTPPTATPSNPPDDPKPPTVREALIALLETLRR